MVCYLNLVGVFIRVETPFPLLDNDSTKEFITNETSDALINLHFSFIPVDNLPAPENICHTEERRIYTGEGNNLSTFFSPIPGGKPYAWVSRERLNDGELICEYIPGKESLMNYKRNVLTLMDLEATLLHFNALIIHASFIRLNGKGVIFSAPSGTGKSTQADLWKKYANAEILNGDRVALRESVGVWNAYGLPYAGTSGIYRNETAPLTAIVALRQADKNSIRRINGRDAFRYLYPETMIHRWDRDFENKATSLLLDILQRVPIFLLECRPDKAAVEMLMEQIDL